jgi:hypothetical protein
METAGVMDSIDMFYPAKRARERNFYQHPSPKKRYADWCRVKAPDRIILDSSLVVSDVVTSAFEHVKDAEDVKRTVENEFNRLAREWSAAVGNISSLTAMAEHPKYREIIDLGWDVVPFLLHDLQRNRRFWFPALTKITTIQPYDPRDTGNSKRMIDAWIEWGKKKQLI